MAQAFSMTFMSGLLAGHSNGFSNFRSAGLGQGFGLKGRWWSRSFGATSLSGSLKVTKIKVPSCAHIQKRRTHKGNLTPAPLHEGTTNQSFDLKIMMSVIRGFVSVRSGGDAFPHVIVTQSVI